MKACIECGKPAKPLRRGKCHACYLRQWRKDNPDKYKRNHKASDRALAKAIDKKRTHLRKILEEGRCVDCGIEDIRVLTFDHTDPSQKVESISRMAASGYSWDKFTKELEKCEIVCANCHQIRTGTRGGWWKW